MTPFVVKWNFCKVQAKAILGQMAASIHRTRGPQVAFGGGRLFWAVFSGSFSLGLAVRMARGLVAFRGCCRLGFCYRGSP